MKDRTFKLRPIQHIHARARTRLVRLGLVVAGGALLFGLFLDGAGIVSGAMLVTLWLVVFLLVEGVWWVRRWRGVESGFIRLTDESVVFAPLGESSSREVALDDIWALYASPFPWSDAVSIDYASDWRWLPRSTRSIAGDVLQEREAPRIIRRQLRARLARGGLEEVAQRSTRVEQFLGALTARWPWATVGTGVVLVVAFWWQSQMGPQVEGVSQRLFGLVEAGALVPALSSEGQWFRTVTYQFVHRDAAHLAANLVALGLTGAIVELFLRAERWLLVTTSVGVTVGLLGLMRADYLVSAGFSGVCYGLAGALLVVWLRTKEEWPSALRLVVFILVVNDAFALVRDVVELGGDPGPIDHQSHVYGYLLGGLVTYLLVTVRPSGERARRPLQAVEAAATLLLAVTLLGLVWGGLYRGSGPHYRDAELLVAEVGALTGGRSWEPAAQVALRNGYAWRVANDPSASLAALARAEGTARRVVQQAPSEPTYRDTLARLVAIQSVRRGDVDRLQEALVQQRIALRQGIARGAGGEELAHYASQLQQFVDACNECDDSPTDLDSEGPMSLLAVGQSDSGTPMVAWRCIEQRDAPVYEPDSLSRVASIDYSSSPGCLVETYRWRAWPRVERLPALVAGGAL